MLTALETEEMSISLLTKSEHREVERISQSYLWWVVELELEIRVSMPGVAA